MPSPRRPTLASQVCRPLARAVFAGAVLLGALGAAPASAAASASTTTLTVYASGSLAGNVGPVMQVRLNGVVVASTELRSAQPTRHRFQVPTITAGARLDVVFTNDAVIDGQDRNLFVDWVRADGTTVFASASGVSFDRGSAERAFDGIDVFAGQRALYSAGALRFTWPGAASAPERDRAGFAASRALQQASFGPTQADIDMVRQGGFSAWLNAQMAMPYQAVYVPAVQARFDRGAASLPGGADYSPIWINEAWWRTAATAPDQLRHRVAFALQQIFVVSQVDSNLWHHARPYARYLDSLQQHAFGNYRRLLEAVALNPVMGIYLSHLRNQREDPSTGRLPDENFARELMQLFTIGLHELNEDGSLKLDADGEPIETYSNADVMALARVFTGWSWAYDPAEQTDASFRWGTPSYATTGSARVDLRPMANYANHHSPMAKTLFAGKPHGVDIPAGTPGPESLKLALDALFRHPNVGPFIGRQLIQRLVSSNPSPAYVARVARAFNNNGKGQRGDLSAVVRAVLLDPEAREAPGPDAGKLREPVLRVTHWMRAFGATSATGRYALGWDLQDVGQRPLNSPSVFNYFRPGYVPPTTGLADAGLVAPEFQIANESTVVAWINLAERLNNWGIGWTGSGSDVTSTLATEAALAESNPPALVDRLNLLLFAGRMPDNLRFNLLDAMHGVSNSSATRGRDRARLAVFLAMASPQYLVQR